MDGIEQGAAIEVVGNQRTTKLDGEERKMNVKTITPLTGKRLDKVAFALGLERKVISKRLGIFPVMEKDWRLRYRVGQALRNLPVKVLRA